MSDASPHLVEAARQGDRDAFRRLVECHWSPLVRLARSVVGEAEAEDAVQEGLVLAWGRLARLREAARFTPWLTTIVFRRCLRRARRFSRFTPLPDLDAWGPQTAPQDDVLVWQVLAHLAPRQRAVLHMTVVEGMSDGEIARALDISAASVRSHRRRARERAAALLNGDRP